jgi:hypothetical protein
MASEKDRSRVGSRVRRGCVVFELRTQQESGLKWAACVRGAQDKNGKVRGGGDVG